jgi:hypothetical protein
MRPSRAFRGRCCPGSPLARGVRDRVVAMSLRLYGVGTNAPDPQYIQMSCVRWFGKIGDFADRNRSAIPPPRSAPFGHGNASARRQRSGHSRLGKRSMARSKGSLCCGRQDGIFSTISYRICRGIRPTSGGQVANCSRRQPECWVIPGRKFKQTGWGNFAENSPGAGIGDFVVELFCQ